MKKISEGKYEKSFVATNKELLDMEFPYFNGTCDLCFESGSDKWFVHKEAGSGSMDDFICPKCIKKIDKLLDSLAGEKE